MIISITLRGERESFRRIDFWNLLFEMRSLLHIFDFSTRDRHTLDDIFEINLMDYVVD